MIIMIRYFIFLNIIAAYFVASIVPGPSYPPTNGELWPIPSHQETNPSFFTYNPSTFKVNVTKETCDVLTKAIERYKSIVKALHQIVKQENERSLAKRNKRVINSGASLQNLYYEGVLQDLEVELTAPCEEYPYFQMEERYNLNISLSSKLSSNSIWGILRGLESWSQLFYLSEDYSEVRINKTVISDSPLYSHRGLLLDTSRHYIQISNILRILDGMAFNKLNVFHWHIVDDQSFPYQSERFPSLSAKGAYHSSMIYTKENIQYIINYARDRGIRVIPEFDVPGHTRSWGVAYPRVLTKCMINDKVVGLGPMNPTKNATYLLLQELIKEVQEWFPDKYFHVGGDEVDMRCWRSNPDIQKFMEDHNLTSSSELHAYFMARVVPMLGNRSRPIVWQEVLNENVPLPQGAFVQFWLSDVTYRHMREAAEKGYKIIFSTSWYLDHLSTGGDWEKFYKADPQPSAYWRPDDEPVLENIIVGGEACMWGESVDDTNVVSRIWPRASATAERLWSSNAAHYVSNEVRARLEEHTCRMKRRDIDAQPPNGPGFCVVPHRPAKELS